MDINFQLSYGYHYMIFKVHARWNVTNPAIPLTYATPPQVFLVKDGGKITLQKSPFDLALVSTPSEVLTVDTSNPDPTIRPFPARLLDWAAPADILYVFRDTIQIAISNIANPNPAPDTALPSYLELMLIGRYFPALQQAGWKK